MKDRRRQKSITKIYHITNKGNNGRDIFFDSDDHKMFLNIIKKEAKKLGLEIYSYCDMNNHFHLLLYDPFDNLRYFMQNLQSDYAKYFNRKYDFNGHLFQGPYHSECVEDDTYFNNSVRYINRNPVKAYICKRVENYRWSSASEFNDKKTNITNIDYVKQRFKISNINNILEFLNDNTNDNYFDKVERYRMKDNEAEILYSQLLSLNPFNSITDMKIEELIRFISELRKRGFSVRQIVFCTGLPKNFIEKTH